MANDLKFVDSVAASPTTLLDLNDQAAGGFYLGALSAPPPPLRRGLTESILTDGQRLSTSSYDNRAVSLTLRTLGTSDQTSLAIQKLGRIVNGPRAILRWQPQGATLPVFFDVIRSPINTVDETLQHLAQNTREVEVELMAAPAAYGLPRSGSVTINNDPAAASFACFWDVDASETIRGDLEAPLFITTNAETTLGSRGFMIASSALKGATQSAPFIVQLPPVSGVAVSGFTTATGDAAMSGGNYYRYTSTGATAQAAALIWNAGVFVMAGNPPGDYRVFARYRTNAPGDHWALSLTQYDATLAVNEGAAAGTSNTSAGWLDLGVFRFPFGGPAADTLFGTTPVSAGTRIRMDLSLPINSVAGDTFDLDVLMFVPAGLDHAVATRMMTAQIPFGVGSTSAKFVIGQDGDAYILNASDQVGSLGFPSTLGPGPSVVPGCDNSLHLIRTVAGLAGSAADVLTATTVLNWQYWPRYLYVRPAST